MQASKGILGFGTWVGAPPQISGLFNDLFLIEKIFH